MPGDGASKLGGRPELPGAWPRNAAGFGLTHLASIALAELPEIEGRDLLPAGGTLVFFGDFHPDSEGDEWLVLYVDGGETAVPPDEERDEYVVPVELPEQTIGFQPRADAPGPEGLSTADEDAVEWFDDIEYPTHLHARAPGVLPGRGPVAAPAINLLHLGWDEDWGFDVRRRRRRSRSTAPARTCAPAAGTAIQALFESS